MPKLLPAILLLLALTAQQAHAIVPVVEDGEGEFLVVRSNGYSRFEIEDGDIVANMTGGVEFEYLGYRLFAEEVRYNQATRIAEAMGNVSLAAPGLGAVGDAVRLDGLNGTFTLDGSVAGNLQEQALSFSADHVQIALPEGEGLDEPSFERAKIEITGNVQASVPQYGSFAADSISYDGVSGSLSIPRQFTAKLQAESLGAELPGVTQDGSGGQIELVGDSLTGIVHERRGLESIEIAKPRISSAEGQLSGSVLTIREVGTEQKPAWRVSMDGGPVSGRLRQPEGDVEFSSDEVVVLLDEEGLRNLSLSGKVLLSGAYAEVSAQEVWIVRRSDGMEVTRGRGLSADFNLAQLTGTEPRTLSEVIGAELN